MEVTLLTAEGVVTTIAPKQRFKFTGSKILILQDKTEKNGAATMTTPSKQTVAFDKATTCGGCSRRETQETRSQKMAAGFLLFISEPLSGSTNLRQPQ
jgi:hypothetical protein